jgi:hypothetical protein
MARSRGLGDVYKRQAGAPMIRAEAVHRVTPEDLWKLPLKVVYSS